MATLFEGKVRTEAEFRQWWDIMLPLYYHRYDPAVGEAMLGRTVGNPEIARYMFEHVIPHYDVRAHLGTIDVPSLVISGRHDWITPPSQGEQIHRLIPGSEFVLFENSGHMPFIEEQEAFLTLVRRFLGLAAPTQVAPEHAGRSPNRRQTGQRDRLGLCPPRTHVALCLDPMISGAGV